MNDSYEPDTNTLLPPDTKAAMRARQGVISGRVLLVLTTSMVLAVIALVVAFLVR
jgi:hypothetical protein